MTKRQRQRQGRSDARLRKQPARNPPSPAIPIVAGAIIVIIIAAAALIASQSRRILSAGALGGGAAPVATARALPTEPVPYPDVARISLQETTDKLEQGQAVLIDVRDRSSYDAGHAAGALSFPESEIDSRLNELPRDKELILYCT
jgi:hypothetical protein